MAMINWGVVVLDDGGTPFDKSDDHWQRFTTEEDPLTDSNIVAIAIDGQGRAWIATSHGYDGLNVVDIGGTLMDKTDDQWHVFRTADGLFSGSLYSLAIDAAGRIWVGGDALASVLDCGDDPFDGTGDQWMTFYSADGLEKRYVYGIAIDSLGQKWFAKAGIGEGPGVVMLDDAGTPFDKADDDWQSFSTADGLASDNLYGVVADPQDRKWFFGSGGVSVVGTDVQVLWESTAPANPVGVTQISSDVGTLNATGKLHLRGVLTSTTGQVVASDDYGFYIFDTDTSLTLDTDRRIYRPGQTIALSGEVQNNSGAPLTGQTLTIAQDGATIYTEGPFDVPSGGSYPFGTTTSAPGGAGTTGFVATVGSIQIQDEVQVVAPQVEAALQAPDLAGSQPFTVTVVLTNSGEIEAAVTVDIEGGGEAAVIPAGETRLVQRVVQIAEDTTVHAVLSGDLEQTLSHDVLFGEAAEAAFYPPPAPCPGLVEISYVLTNTGQLDAEFTTMVTLTGSLDPISELQIDSYLPLSATQEGALAVELAADDYTLDWQHPYGSGQVGITVPARDQLTLDAMAGPSDGVQAPVTVTLTNVGCNPFSGTLAVEAEAASGPFYGDQQPVDVELAGSGVYTFALDTEGLAPGVYTATLALRDGSGQTLGTASAGGELPGSDLLVSALPVETTLVASQTVTLTFGIENVGAAGDRASLTFSLGDMEDETQFQWLEAGQTGVLTYTFFVPSDLVSGDYPGTYALTGERDPDGETGDLIFQVQGISLTVEAETDKAAYLEGELATITLSVGNDGVVDTGDLQALVVFNGITQTQTFGLAPGASLPLDFEVEASFAGDAKVFYGVYDADTDRSIVLDTFYLRQLHPLLTLLPDKQVYQPGESVVATLVTTLTQGTLDVFAPGYAGDLAIADGNQVTFELPDPLARGTYALYYVTSGSGTEEDGRERFTAFDVDGPSVFVRAAALRQGTYDPGDTVELDLTVTSDRAVEATLRGYIAYPDRTAGQVISQPVLLAGSVVNPLLATAVLSGTQMGQHQMRYQLVQESARGDVILAEGSEPFDVGPAALRRVTTDQESYPWATDPVQARLNLYSGRGGLAHVTLHLDDGPVTAQTTILDPGCGVLTVTLDAPIPPGRRILTATLEMDGHSALARTHFAYGTSLPDLRPGSPWVAAGGTVTRTVAALVSNHGPSAADATMVRFFDGDPDLGGSLIGSVGIPTLEAAAQATAAVEWNILGEGGEHNIYVVVDPVIEYDTGNNQAQAVITLPRLDTALTVAPGHVEAGGTIALGVQIENLQAAADLPVTATLQIRSLLGNLVYERVWTETLVGSEVWWLNDVWQSGEGPVLGIYSVVQETCDSYGECYQNRSSFIVGPLDTHSIYLPLVMRRFAQ
jgi:hypothetical protein